MGPTAHVCDDQLTTQRARSSRGPVVASLVIVAVTVAAAAGVLVGTRLSAGSPGTPGTDSIDAGFARDMHAHHIQAVQMSLLVSERSRDPQLRTLARDILLTQQQQAGQMYGWLQQWNLAQSSSRPAMTWLPHGATDMAATGHGTASSSSPGQESESATLMPGMASAQELDRLRQSTGTEADRIYLQMVIPHHQGGVLMAGVAVDKAGDPDVRRLAQTIVDSQTAELTVLEEMLAARGGPVTGS